LEATLNGEKDESSLHAIRDILFIKKTLYNTNA
jgi:hypothetical protein